MTVMDYRTRDGTADYGFSIEYESTAGWRVYILFQPYRDDVDFPYEAIDHKGRRYVDWSTRLNSLGEAKTVAGLWAELAHRFQHSRITLGRIIDSSLPVSIYLEAGHEPTIGRVESALRELGSRIGFDLIEEGAPIRSSFWQKLRAKAADPYTQEQIMERLLKLEYATEVKLLAVPESQATMQNAQGLAVLIEALKGEPAAVIQLGPLILVKAPRPEGDSAILCRKLTPKELRMLEVNPGLLRDPVTLMARLATPDEGHHIAQAQ